MKMTKLLPRIGIHTAYSVWIARATLNSLTTKMQTTKVSSANFQKMLSPSLIILRIRRLEANSVDLDEVAHYEPPHQDLRSLQILVLKELRW